MGMPTTEPPTASLCLHCSRPVIEAGRNWTHADGSYRCRFPFNEPGMAEPAPSHDEIVEALFDAADNENPCAAILAVVESLAVNR